MSINTTNGSVLITGGLGFIGVNLSRYLSNKGFKIRILDNQSVGKPEHLALAGCNLDAVEIITGDILDPDITALATQNCSAVVHLAAHTGIMQSMENPQENWKINVNGILNILENCRKNGASKLIFSSSNAALGQQVPPYDESKIPRPLSPYGASKLASEALCSAYYNSYSLDTVSLRFSNCYGPYSAHKTSVVSKFMRTIRDGKPITIYGDGQQSRDFINVEDICKAIHLCLSTSKPIGGEVFQVAHGTETTVNILVDVLKQVTGLPVKTVFESKRKGDIERNYSDISKASKVLGFTPDVELSAGITAMWQWFKKLS